METLKNIGKIHAQVLADYILKHYGPMSHLKVQKLLYYCEAYHLAYFDANLVREEFEAWVHGPVCREVYNQLKENSLLYSDLAFDGSYNPDEVIQSELSTDQQQLIKDVLVELSTWSGLQLEAATHNEKPWIEARVGFGPADRCENIVSKETMRDFYKEELNVQ